MRVPQVSERIKEVPAQALRGVFAGIGQLLLITDKLRNKAPIDAGQPRARTPERPKPVADAPASEPAVSQEKATVPAPAPAAAAKSSSVKPPRTEAPKPPPTPRTRDFDKTGNVRLLDDAETSAAAPAETAAPETAAPAAAPAAGSEAGDSGPPLPNYDELSVASLRARLRNLDVSRVRQLAEYERAHAARADVITMFERRIAKLEADA
jgi:hypothetical protein